MVKRIVSLLKRLRDYIVARMHTGHLRPGDQLPSYRELSQKWEVDHRMIARAYRALEEEDLVEVRGRAGVFLREQERIGGELPTETAQWVATDVITEAWQRRIKIPEMPKLMQRCIASVKLRTACIESNEDHRYLLCHELSEWFGFATESVPTSSLPDQDAASRVSVVPADELPEAVLSADVLVTTGFHAHVVRPIAAVLNKPLVVVAMHPLAAELLLDSLGNRAVTVLCVDPEFGERVRLIVGPEYRDRVRVVLAGDTRAVGRLDPDEPVFISTAAAAQLDRHPPSIVRELPAFSPDSAAELGFLLIRLNIERTPSPE